MSYINQRKSKIVEGELGSKELSLYLEGFHQRKCVWLSEDATGIVGKIEFDPSTNQMVGLVLPINSSTGMPMTHTYLARDVNEIQKNMKQNKSMYAYVVMAQPLDRNIPPFPLQIFGSDNKFTTQNVLSRWQHTVEDLER